MPQGLHNIPQRGQAAVKSKDSMRSCHNLKVRQESEDVPNHWSLSPQLVDPVHSELKADHLGDETQTREEYRGRVQAAHQEA